MEVWRGGEYRNNVLLCATMQRETLAELNAKSGDATGKVGMWRKKGRLAVSKAQGMRLSQAYFRIP